MELSKSPGSKKVALQDLELAIRNQKTTADRLDVVAGHDVFFGMHEISSRLPFYFTVLRDPVERYISHYHHMVDVACGRKGNRQAYPNSSVILENGKPISLHEFAKRKIMTNVMTNYLASAANTDRDSKRWEIRDPDQLVKMAESCLRSMNWIGFVERFPQDMQEICDRIGVQLSVAMNRSVTDATQELTDETLEMIRWNNSLDTRIYAIAESIRQGNEGK